ncbi:MAG: aromatic amino acid lyase, partial [Thermodesulfobacteriota bacterium]
MEDIIIGKDGMTLSKLAGIARKGTGVRLSKGSENRIKASRKLIEKWVAEERPVYGVTTGFGALSDVTISRKDTRRLQQNILMSHSAGVGRALEPEIV